MAGHRQTLTTGGDRTTLRRVCLRLNHEGDRGVAHEGKEARAAAGTYFHFRLFARRVCFQELEV